jgi:hypothetical protein
MSRETQIGNTIKKLEDNRNKGKKKHTVGKQRIPRFFGGGVISMTL